MDKDLLQMLADVAHAGCFYETLLPRNSRLRLLQQLESLGYIRYCRYPDEFWVVLPRGKEFLSSRVLRASHG